MKTSVTITMSKYAPEETINKLNKTNTDYIHIDVMDGKFVPQILFPYEEVKNYLKDNKKPLDVHLMVSKVKKNIKKFSKLNPEIITYHFETNVNHKKIIDYIKSNDIKAGISIKPNTKVKEIKHLLAYVDHVLIMTVEPGLGGQTFIQEMIPKIEELINERKTYNYAYTISVDGGINEKTAKLVKDVDIISTGSFVCMHEDFQSQINKLIP